MKNIKKIFAAALVLLMLSSSVIAADTTLKNVTLTTETSASGISGITPNGTVNVVTDSTAIGGSAKVFEITPASRIDVQGWSGTNSDNFVIEIPFKPASTTTKGGFIFRSPAGAFDQLFQIQGTNFAINNQAVSNTTVGSGWQTLRIVYRQNPMRKLYAYVDNSLIGSLTAAIPHSAYSASGMILRITSSSNTDKLYVGSINIFKPEAVQITAADNEINLPTDPVTVNFSRPVEVNSTTAAEIGKENFTVTDKNGNNVTINEVTTTKNDDGMVTSATLTFADGALEAGGKYSVALTGCIGNYGQSIAEPVNGSYTFSVYAPDPVEISAVKSELEFLDETVTVNFSEPITMADGEAFGIDDVQVADEDGNSVEVAAVSSTTNDDGKITSVTLTFAENALSYSTKYSVTVTGCLGIYNQGVAEPEDGEYLFSVLSAPYDYKWDEVKVFKYTGLNKNEINTLTAGMISVEAQYSNSGRLSKNVTLIAEVYRGSELAYRMETANRALGSNGDSLKSDIGLYLSSASDITVNIKLVDADGNTLLEKKGADLFEN